MIQIIHSTQTGLITKEQADQITTILGLDTNKTESISISGGTYIATIGEVVPND